jgi:multiple sugar transport system substrate-binding protein
MQFVLRADVQEDLNKAMLQLPVNNDARVVDDRFLLAGRNLIASAQALTQYYDRDTSEDLANVAMKGFQEFMLQPQRLSSILAAIERARERIYGPLPARTAPH